MIRDGVRIKARLYGITKETFRDHVFVCNGGTNDTHERKCTSSKVQTSRESASKGPIFVRWNGLKGACIAPLTISLMCTALKSRRERQGCPLDVPVANFCFETRSRYPGTEVVPLHLCSTIRVTPLNSRCHCPETCMILPYNLNGFDSRGALNGRDLGFN